jgi:hypothetical protein
MERIRDFLILHYRATDGAIREFWRYCGTMSIPEPLERVIRLFADSGASIATATRMFALTSWVQVLIGTGVVPDAYHPLVDAVPDDELDAARRQCRGRHRKLRGRDARARAVHRAILSGRGGRHDSATI